MRISAWLYWSPSSRNTLSACWSGAGRLGLFGAAAGFPHALILKGAQSVVLSLWNVDDAATAILMRRFYENLLGRRTGLDHPLPKSETRLTNSLYRPHPGHSITIR